MQVYTYGQYCPVARATEILGMRWTPIIVRNLLIGCETFSELKRGRARDPPHAAQPAPAPARAFGIVERLPGRSLPGRGPGRDLEGVVDALGIWGARWLEVAPEHFDAHIVLWSLCRTAGRGHAHDGS